MGDLMLYMDEDGKFKEYDCSLDYTINFEDREQLEDFTKWMSHEGYKSFREWRKKKGEN